MAGYHKKPIISRASPVGPQLLCRNGKWVYLSWWDRFLLHYKFIDVFGLEKKYTK